MDLWLQQLETYLHYYILSLTIPASVSYNELAMLTTPHVLLGLYFGFNYPAGISLPASLISHWLFDFFYPHWNPHLFTEMKKKGRLSPQTLLIIALDFFIALLLVLYFAWTVRENFTQSLTLFACALLAILPDLLEVPFYFFKSQHIWMKQLVTFEHLHQARANIWWGSLSQIMIIISCLWGIFQSG